MANRPTVFLRRIKRAHVSIVPKDDGGFAEGVSPDAFVCDEEDLQDGLSLSVKAKALEDPRGILLYRRLGKLKDSGDLPAVAVVDLGRLIAMGVIQYPKWSADPNDPLGMYHHTIPCPEDEGLRAALAQSSKLELPMLPAKYDVDKVPTVEEILEQYPPRRHS